MEHDGAASLCQHETGQRGHQEAPRRGVGLGRQPRRRQKRFAVFRCNMHLNCPKLVRAAKCDNEFILQEKGEHAEELKKHKRKNSPLTLEQERILKVAADSGGTPGGVLVSLSKTKMKEMRDAGLNPFDKQHKRKDGGLIGTLHGVCSNSVSTVYQRMYHSVSCSVS